VEGLLQELSPTHPRQPRRRESAWPVSNSEGLTLVQNCWSKNEKGEETFNPDIFYANLAELQQAIKDAAKRYVIAMDGQEESTEKTRR
jgi:hypothetical protein